MNFTSLPFLLGFPLTVFLHWIIPAKYRWGLLLMASWLFYFSAEPRAFVLILTVTAVSYFAGRKISETQNAVLRKCLLAGVVVVSMGILFVFKYLDFFLGTALGLLLPAGISFYTFQSLSYVIDVYHGAYPPERHFGYYALYISFFPQLVAGPIERPQDLLPQLHMPREYKREDLMTGALWILKGFVKKIVIADQLARVVDPVFASPSLAEGFSVALAAVLFAVQIYCDFSGYSEIALGSARMMGIRLTRNFETPYQAESLQDFWRRWHVSLTRWFTRYLYIPLGGDRKGKWRTCVNLLVVFLASGLWHGAGWTFVIWGLLHGTGLIAERLWRKEGSRTGQGYRMAVMAFVVLSWIVFRAASLSDAMTLYSRLFSGWDLHTAVKLCDLSLTRVMVIVTALVLMFVLDHKEPEATVKDASYTVPVFYLLLALGTGWLSLLASGGGNAFIYFRF